jgi:hypothetical protein
MASRRSTACALLLLTTSFPKLKIPFPSGFVGHERAPRPLASRPLALRLFTLPPLTLSPLTLRPFTLRPLAPRPFGPHAAASHSSEPRRFQPHAAASHSLAPRLCVSLPRLCYFCVSLSPMVAGQLLMGSFCKSTVCICRRLSDLFCSIDLPGPLDRCR